MMSIQLEEESSQDLISKYNEWLIVSYNHHGCLVVYMCSAQRSVLLNYKHMPWPVYKVYLKVCTYLLQKYSS